MGLFSKLFGRGKKDNDAPAQQDAPTPPASRPVEQVSFPDESLPAEDNLFDSDAFLDSFSPSVSFDFSLSKESLYEGLSLTAASLEDATRYDQSPISNERIRKGDPMLDTYTVETDAISGGMGSVWRVHHTSWNKDLAMKRPQPRFFAEAGPARKAAFVAECENWINLGLHPNIVSCYYVREVGGVPTVFSEWMDGGSLKDVLASGALSEGSEAEVQARILDIAIQTARGLAYSHEKGLLHLDVKPGNVLLAPGWEAKVADFGLAMSAARLAGTDTSMGANPAGGSLGYTLAYAPREQTEGAHPEAWMDAYAWALTVLEMYVGERSWRSGAEVPAHLDELMDQARISIPSTMRELFKRCLCKHGDDLSALAEELEKCYAELTGASYPRQDSASATDVADALNNRALSMLDLQMDDEAERLWQQALEANPAHLASVYNRALYDWRNGTIDDVEARRLVQAVQHPHTDELVRRLDDETGYADELVAELPALANRSATYATPELPAPYARYLKDGARIIKTNHTWMRMVDAKTDATLVEYDLSMHDENASLAPLAIDEEERYIVSSDAYGMVYVWDLPTGKCLHAVKGHAGWARTAAIDAAGDTFATAGLDKVLKIWSIRTGRCTDTITLPGGACALALDEYAGWALIGRDYGEIFLLSLPDGAEMGHMRGAYEKVEYLQFVERNDELYGLSCSGGEVRLWDVLGDRCLKTVEGHRCWWDGKSAIFVDALDHTLRWTLPDFGAHEATWELSEVQATEEVLELERAFTEALANAWAGIEANDLPAAIEALEVARGCRGFENDERLGQLETRLGSLCPKVGIHSITHVGSKHTHESPRDVRVSETGYVFITTDIDMLVWAVGAEKPTFFFRDSLVWETGKLSKVFLADGGTRVLVSTYISRYALLGFSEDGAEVVQRESPFLEHERQGYGFCVSPGLRWIAYTSKDGTYLEQVGVKGARRVLDTTPDTLALSADGRYLFYVDEETRKLVKLDVDAEHVMWQAGTGLDSYAALALDFAGERVLALSDEDERYVIFDAQSGKQLVALHMSNGYDCGKAVFSSDGRFVFTHSQVGKSCVYVYDAASGELVFELGGTGGVEFFDLSDDMRTLYTTNTDGELRVWRVAYQYEA